jgi:hypothetical protein
VKYQAMVELQVVGTFDDLDGRADQLADALYDLHDVIDPDLGGSITEGRLDVTMVVEADDLADATAKSLCAVRAAVHAVGGSTPGWERYIREVSAQARTLVDA